MGTNPRHRKRDQTRVRIMAVLGDGEGPALRGGGAVLSRVLAALERQLARVRAGRHGDGLGAAGEVEVAKPNRQEGDHYQGGDPPATEPFAAGRVVAVAGQRLVVQQDGFHGGSLSRFVVLNGASRRGFVAAMDPAGVWRWRLPASRWCASARPGRASVLYG